MSSTLNIDEILYLVYEQTQQIMDATNFYIALYDEQNDSVHFKLAIESGLRQEVGIGDWKSRKGGGGLTEYIIREKKPFLLSKNAEERIRSSKIDPIGKLAKSWIGAPMIVGGKVLGVISIQNYERENAYDLDHLNVLMTTASQTAIAISKANIFQEAKNRLHELEALYDTSKEIAEKTLDIKSVLQAIVKRAVDLTKAQGGTILLCDHAEEELKCVITYNLDVLLGVIVKFGTGAAGRVAQSGKPMLYNDYYKWKGIEPIFKLKKYKNLFRAVVAVPLKSEGKVIGVLSITSSEKNRIFTEDDIRLLERFAIPAAIALNNARTHYYLQTLIGNTPDAIIAVDKNGIITEFNRTSERILGYRMSDVVGKHINNLYWGGTLEAKRINSLLRTVENGKVREVLTFMKSKEGEKIPIRFSGSLLYDENGERIGSVGHMEDMREIRLLEDRYRALYEVGKAAVEIPESNMKIICQEFIDILTQKVLHFKSCFLYLMNDDNELELMASGGPPEKTNRHVTKISSLDTPLIVRGQEIGQIIVSKGNEQNFLKEEIELLNRFTSLAALVIDKARDMHRSKKIAKTLQEFTYDIVELSGEDLYGDIWDKITDIIARWVPNSNIALYRCDPGSDQFASLIEKTTQDFQSRLKSTLRPGEIPFKSESNINSEYLILPARSHHGRPGRLEGLLVVEKTLKEDAVARQFGYVERLLLPMLASVVGSALFRLRSLLQQKHPSMSETNNIRKADE